MGSQSGPLCLGSYWTCRRNWSQSEHRTRWRRWWTETWSKWRSRSDPSSITCGGICFGRTSSLAWLGKAQARHTYRPYRPRRSRWSVGEGSLWRRRAFSTDRPLVLERQSKQTRKTITNHRCQRLQITGHKRDPNRGHFHWDAGADTKVPKLIFDAEEVIWSMKNSTILHRFFVTSAWDHFLNFSINAIHLYSKPKQ